MKTTELSDQNEINEEIIELPSSNILRALSICNNSLFGSCQMIYSIGICLLVKFNSFPAQIQ